MNHRVRTRQRATTESCREHAALPPAACSQNPRVALAVRVMAGALVGAIALLGSSCASTQEGEELSPEQRWHESMLSQLGEAWSDRDVDRMKSLLDKSRDGASRNQVERYATFEGLLGAAQIERGGFAYRGVFAFDKGEPSKAELPDLAMDAPVDLRLRIETTPDVSLRIKARHGSAKSMLLVTMKVVDILDTGSSLLSEQPFRHEFEADLLLDAKNKLELALPPLPAPGPRVQIRQVSYEGVLVCAALEKDGVPVPLPRFDLRPLTLTRLPKGFEAVRAKPLRTLRVALGQASQYRAHVLVASWLLARDGNAKDREAAMAALVEQLRSGPLAAEKVALLSLEYLAQDEAPMRRDREGWLRWWGYRKLARGKGDDAASREAQDAKGPKAGNSPARSEKRPKADQAPSKDGKRSKLDESPKKKGQG